MTSPLHIDTDALRLNGEFFIRAEQWVALLQRRLMRPMSRGGPRGELSVTQYHILSFLASRGKASVSEIKDMLGLAQSTTSVLVDKLARLGLVEKLRDKKDQRLACIVALPKGLRMVQRYRRNAERNLLGLRACHGDLVVQDVLDALERAVVATAPLENAAVVRAGNAGFYVDEDDNDDNDDNDGNEEEEIEV